MSSVRTREDETNKTRFLLSPAVQGDGEGLTGPTTSKPLDSRCRLEVPFTVLLATVCL